MLNLKKEITQPNIKTHKLSIVNVQTEVVICIRKLSIVTRYKNEVTCSSVCKIFSLNGG